MIKRKPVKMKKSSKDHLLPASLNKNHVFLIKLFYSYFDFQPGINLNQLQKFGMSLCKEHKKFCITKRKSYVIIVSHVIVMHWNSWGLTFIHNYELCQMMEFS